MKRHRSLKFFILLFLSVATAVLSSAAEPLAADFDSLVGRWQRPDGGYVLEIQKVEADGKAAVRYYNPRPINVSRAEASGADAHVKIFVELRDAGYPGSTYTLVHEPEKDILLGVYYQAVAGQYFEVVFVRMR